MDKADAFILTNGKFFASHKVAQIKEKLLQLDESKWGAVETLQFNYFNTWEQNGGYSGRLPFGKLESVEL